LRNDADNPNARMLAILCEGRLDPGFDDRVGMRPASWLTVALEEPGWNAGRRVAAARTLAETTDDLVSAAFLAADDPSFTRGGALETLVGYQDTYVEDGGFQPSWSAVHWMEETELFGIGPRLERAAV